MQQPDAHTMDYVIAIIAVGALVIGLISMLIGRVVAWWDWLRTPRETVNHSEALMSPDRTPATTDQQTDKADRPLSAGLSVADQWLDRVEVDRTRAAIIELMVYSGWQVGEIRQVVKGDNGAIGIEVEAARKKLGIVGEPRMLKIKDTNGERSVPIESPASL